MGSAAVIEAGTIIDGRYEVLRRVGSGGMADVYLASDRLLGRQVALKLLHYRFAEDQEFVERFKREASSAAGLSHPNVVSIFDRGEWDGTYYIVMEYLPGRTLKAIVREHGPLPPAAAIDVTVQVLRAARFAHRRGVIHRDLKPHNVILDEEGRAKVTDFGIARAGASDMTLTGSIMGTAQYLSPEQAQGQQVSESSDIYALGVVLYELLTGKVPFEGETAVTIALQHISRQPPPPSSLNPAVPASLDAIVAKALQKDPAARYRSADEAIAALETVRATLPAPRGEHSLADLPHGLGSGERSDGAGQSGPRDRAGGAAWAAGAAAMGAAAGLAGSAGADPTGPAPAIELGAAGASPAGQPPSTDLQPGAGSWAATAPDNGGAWHPSAGQLAAYDPGRGTQSPSVGGAWSAAGTSSLQARDRRRRWLIWSAAIVAALIVATLAVLLLPASKVRVPSLVGEQRAAATARLHRLGLRVGQSTAASSSVPAGEVVSQNPVQGTLVRPDATVSIVVSTGTGRSSVPRVAGLPESRALQLLREADLRPTIERQASESLKSGTAISTSPPAGRSLVAGSNLVLIVSSGPVQVAVPDVVGEPRAQAEERLEEAGLAAGEVTERRRAGVAAGSVLSQSPRAASKVSTGTRVRLVIAKAPANHPASIVVPSVLEDARESALATLRAAGLKPEVISEVVPNAAHVGYVVRQSPLAGSRLRKGATVKVYVGATAAETQSTTSSSTTSQASTSSTTSQTTSTKSTQAPGG
jgi:eukaryotic-like serine/threonine-protein kinase